MEETETHEMELLGVDDTGAEDWFCPACGRRFLMRWPPDYGRTVLTPGDDHVAHVGGKGGLRMGPLSLQAAPAATGTAEPDEADPPLAPEIVALWQRVLKQIEDEAAGDERS